MTFSWFKKKGVKKKEQERLDDMDGNRKEVLQSEDEIHVDPQASPGFFNRLRSALAKTRKLLSTDIEELFVDNRKVDEELLEELEELLITSDIGVQTTVDLIHSLSKKT